MDEVLVKILKVMMNLAMAIWGFVFIYLWIILFFNYSQLLKDLKDYSFWLFIIGLPIFAAI